MCPFSSQEIQIIALEKITTKIEKVITIIPPDLFLILFISYKA